MYDIAFYFEPSGREPVADWLASLDKKTRNYLQDKSTRLKQNGPMLLNTGMMRALKGYGGGFYEIKYDKYRIVLYYDQVTGTFMALHGFKKERMREAQEIRTAHARLIEFLARRSIYDKDL